MRRGFILLAILIYSCAPTPKIKQMKEPFEDTLTNVPFYHKGSPVFPTKEALRRKKEKKKKEEIEKIEAKVKSLMLNTIRQQMKIPDPWLPPAEDPSLPDALTYLPKDKFGYPDWVAATKQEVIRPRGSIPSKKPLEEEPFLEAILFQINDRLMANVLFPHTTHTYWLSCKSCHPKPFIAKRGANQFGMMDIWAGKYCGKCHGKVAFAPKGFENCQRCHRVKKKTLLPEND
ncbi:MAG: cytochrome c3 family protein [Thermodesulfobacteriota bacterium]